MGLAFGRRINVEFSGDGMSPILINCPATGIKPDIEIQGVYNQSDTVNEFTVRIKNLYVSGLSDYSRIRVWAGYRDKMVLCFEGEASFVFTESPGPDRVTVISCRLGDFNAWTSKYVNISYGQPVRLLDILKSLSDTLGFGTPIIDPHLVMQTLPFFYHIGRASGAVHYLTELMPDVSITCQNNRLTAWKTDNKDAVGLRGTRTFYLNNLSTTPAITGKSVTISSPWNPDVRPGDYVFFPTKFYSQDLAAAESNSIGDMAAMQVLVMNFHFSTVDDANEMQLEGILS